MIPSTIHSQHLARFQLGFILVDVYGNESADISVSACRSLLGGDRLWLIWMEAIGLRRLLSPPPFSQARLLSATMWGSSTGQALDFSHFSLLLSTSYSHCKPFLLRWSLPSLLSD